MKRNEVRRASSTLAYAVAVVLAVSAAEAQQAGGKPASPAAPGNAGPSAATTATTPVVDVFTTLDLKTCKRLASGPDGGRWGCGGPKGYEIQFSEGDLRQFLSYGGKARQQRAATQTLGPFNSIFKDATDRTMIQWRGVMRGGRFVPFATIVRYHTDSGDDGAGKRRRGQVLVVTKLGAPDGAEACHVAYVDAVANTDANARAAKAADDLARGFDCAKEPITLGAKGPSVTQPATRI